MGLQDTLLGSPGQTQVHQAAGTKPPGYNFARDFFSQLMGIANNNPYPTYQGQLDPGLSPTLQNLMRGAQGFQASSMPEIMAGAQGAIGGMMSPKYINPAWRLQGGYNAPFSSSFSGSQPLFNGNPMSSYFGLKGGGAFPDPTRPPQGGPGGPGGGMPPGMSGMTGGGLQGSMGGQGGTMGAYAPPGMGRPPGEMMMSPGGGGWSQAPQSGMPYGNDAFMGSMPQTPQDTSYTSTATPMPKQQFPWGGR